MVDDADTYAGLAVRPGVTATWLAGLFAAGGLVAGLEVLAPSYGNGSRAVRAGLGAVAMVLAVVVYAVRDRLGRRGLHAALIAGVTVVTGSVWNDGRDAALFADAMFYGWVLSLAFAFHRRGVALRYLVLVAAALGGALAAHWRPEHAVAWCIVLVALGVPAVVTGHLVTTTQRLALRDPLTGVLNRRAFFTLLERELARSSRRGEGLALVVLDVDDLKQVNDRGGHAAGDLLLVEAARLWRNALREGDVLARLGGDEFGVLLVDCPTRERALDAVGRLSSRAQGVAASVGVALWRGEKADRLLARADRALYAAKERGKDCAVVADDPVAFPADDR